MRATTRFDCQLYVSRHGAFQIAMPVLSEPRTKAKFVPVSFEAMTDPAFGRLHVALDRLPNAVTLAA
jgi:hypothetical protein